ncbi:SusC/RagA family TonB-linked outer membrane protein [Niabella ginsenosidivorans]|uniref:SusC/RagA family TonB-linked outer membrane protein n=1 Tax=Niabella ginsenosidivorans TaxID=1176587 RepID=A0A1A9HWW8_9BACT|nr:TonB-dependent receptor [Niabella ginsenosidivorans]ANH79733.1 SusC/RagA family TonB-linked outer membrane protein [Niabella ginsenosidivorans]
MLKTKKTNAFCGRAMLGCFLTLLSFIPPAGFTRNAIPMDFAHQQAPVKGKVTDENKTPLEGVTVTEKGTQNSTVTRADGTFSLTVSSDTSVLVFSAIGYQTLEVAAAAASEVTLVKQAQTIDEVVVVGYGSQKKSDLTGSVATISSKNLSEINAPNFVDKIQGRVPGMNINTGNAKPGEVASMTVRGENSISASNQPLIILDGVPFNGSFNDISTSSIENVSVLKDASSTAIYGSRAANGVIIVTTKKGQNGKPRVAYNGYVGVQTVERRLHLMNGPEYIQYMRDYQASKGKTGDELDPENYLFANVLEQWKKGEEVNWQDEVFNKAALVQEHQLSISGGSEKSNYYASVGYLNQDGLVKNTSYERYNVALGLNQTLLPWLKSGLNVQLSQGNTNGVQPSIDNAVKLSPYGKNRDENGNRVLYPMYAQTLYPNPFADENGLDDNTRRTVFAAGFLDAKLPINGLSFKTSFGTNYRHEFTGQYYGANTFSGMSMNGYGQIDNSDYFDWTWENLLTYDRSFGDHKLNVVGLYSAQKTNLKTSSLYGEDFIIDNGYNNLESASKNQKINSNLTNTALISYMGRINYGFKDRYLLTLTGRSDGYSAFSPNNKWAFFPSVAGAWVISREDFFNSKLFNQLKLRLSYGENGNQGVTAYQTFDRLTKIQYLFGDGAPAENGLVINYNGIGSKNLKWETTRSFNIGVDFGLLENRISGSLDFYKTHTFDLLLSRQVPVMNGYNSIWDNVGKTQNTGIELALSSRNIVHEDFSWNTDLTFAYNKNKILELRGDGKNDLTNAWLIGEPIRVFYDYNVIGVWQESDDIKNSWQPNAKPGDAKLEDVNHDGKITADDRKVIGSKMPAYTMGLGNSFQYKNWSLSLFLTGAFDVTKENNFANIERFLPNNGGNFLSDIPYWTPERPSTEYVSPGYTPVNNHSYYLDASYLKIKDVSLGYAFPVDKWNVKGITGIKAFINARNLYTFTKVKGYNPEALSVSATTGNPTTTNVLSPYPVARTVSLGVNVQF